MNIAHCGSFHSTQHYVCVRVWPWSGNDSESILLKPAAISQGVILASATSVELGSDLSGAAHFYKEQKVDDEQLKRVAYEDRKGQKARRD